MRRVIWILVIVVLIIAGGFFTATFSTIDEQIAFGDCKFIEEGDTCSQYTRCVYDPNRDKSCIKGYEVVNASVGEVEVDTADTGGMGAQ